MISAEQNLYSVKVQDRTLETRTQIWAEQKNIQNYHMHHCILIMGVL